jgi:hypothetical protein
MRQSGVYKNPWTKKIISPSSRRRREEEGEGGTRGEKEGEGREKEGEGREKGGRGEKSKRRGKMGRRRKSPDGTEKIKETRARARKIKLIYFLDGPAPYFTVIGTCPEQKTLLEFWDEIKKVASDTLNETGGTITHHHAVGKDHAPW